VEEEARKQPNVAKEYRNDEIVVYWEPSLCIHSANCLVMNPRVFDSMRRPWIDLSEADADDVADAVMTCPSGALHFKRLDGGAEEETDGTTRLYARRDGPIWVRGAVRIVDHEGTVIREDTRVALCRCGQSANKPFCDNTHKKIGFKTA